MSHGRFDSPIVATLTGILDRFRKQPLSDRLKDDDRIDGMTCVITGANSGLGFALAVELAARGGKVIMACRSGIPDAGERVKLASGSANVSMQYLDLSDITSIHDFCDRLKSENTIIDLLILNAGLASPKAFKTESGLDEVFLVNYLSNYILLNLLLSKGVIPTRICGNFSVNGNSIPRVIYISSDSHQGSSAIDYNEFGNFFNYGLKKGMNNYSYYKLVMNTLAVEFSRRINKEKLELAVNVICPGPVNTNIIRSAPWPVRIVLRLIFSIFFQSAKKAARPVVYMGISKDYENLSGAYLHMFKEKKMDPKVYIQEEGITLWENSRKVWERVDPQATVCDI